MGEPLHHPHVGLVEAVPAGLRMAGPFGMPVVEGGKPLPQLIGWLDHQGEHYGKLVTSYRVNGIVPPISRPKS